MDYYNRKIYIPRVNKNDQLLGSVERWEAHKKGILHRAFTVALYVGNELLFQHRRHPVFDGVFDLACSSHPIMRENKVQEGVEAVLETLSREWGLLAGDTSQPVHKGSIRYSARDKNSIYREHEICHLYVVKTNILPILNSEFSYGFSLQTLQQVLGDKPTLKPVFAPWVPKLLPLLD